MVTMKANISRVGRGNPPEYSRFKPGQSGNPSGRPKGSGNIKKEIFDELMSQVRTKVDGNSEEEISLVKACIKVLVAKGLKGDVRALIAVLDYGVKIDNGMTPPAANDNESDQLPPDDEAILAVYVHRIRGEDRNE